MNCPKLPAVCRGLSPGVRAVKLQNVNEAENVKH